MTLQPCVPSTTKHVTHVRAHTGQMLPAWLTLALKRNVVLIGALAGEMLTRARPIDVGRS